RRRLLIYWIVSAALMFLVVLPLVAQQTYALANAVQRERARAIATLTARNQQALLRTFVDQGYPPIRSWQFVKIVYEELFASGSGYYYGVRRYPLGFARSGAI